MALNAGVVGTDEVETLGIDDVLFGGMRDVQAAGTVAFFAAHIPLGNLVGIDVVVDGVAAIAKRAGGAVHVGVSIERDPPVGSLLDMVRKPTSFLYVPLSRQHEVVIATFW